MSDMVLSRREGGIDRGLKAILDRGGHEPRDLAKAIYWAAYTGRADLIELLLSYGGDLNLPNKAVANNARFPLHQAVKAGNLDTINYLLDRGAKVDNSFRESGTALQTAAFHGNSLLMVKRLIEAGANVNAPGGTHGSALHAAASRPFERFRVPNWQGEDDDQEIFDYLLSLGAETTPKTPKYFRGDSGSPLIAAAETGRVKMVETLIQLKVDINERKPGDFPTALHAAARYGEYETVKLLLENEADPNITGGHFGSALNAAARGICRPQFQSIGAYTPPQADKVFELLVDAGARLDDERTGTYSIDVWSSPLLTAANSKHWYAVNMLLDRGVRVTGNNAEVIYAAAGWGNLDLVRRLYDLGVDPDSVEHKYNLIQEACQNAECPLELVQFLVSKGVSTNAKDTSNYFYDTAIDGAVRGNRPGK